jgi:ComF family protein
MRSIATIKEIKESLLHILFPHNCCGCGTDILVDDSMICAECLSSLPETIFHMHGANPVEKKFWGRIPLAAATAHYYFSQGSIVQRLMHEMKYNNNKALGLQLGRLMGMELIKSNRFYYIDALVPLPLFAAKEKKRGYNQATLLCEGMAEVMNKAVLIDIIARREHTETQTKKGRMERWLNMEGKFELLKPEAIADKHILLVDDIITTGATLEACGHEILRAEGVRLSIAAFSYTAQ